MNGALPASRLDPVTMTKYGPVAPDAAVNDPATLPPPTAHVGFEIRPLGDEDIAQLVSNASNPEPRTATIVPGCPEFGVRVIAGVIRKLEVFRSYHGMPVTFTECVPKVAVDNTWNFPVMVPSEIEQVGEETTPLPVITQLVSLVLKPVPVTLTHVLRGP